jgi:hypothetical protein
MGVFCVIFFVKIRGCLRTLCWIKFGDELRVLFVIEKVPDLDKLIRVLKPLEDC